MLDKVIILLILENIALVGNELGFNLVFHKGKAMTEEEV